MRSTPQRFRLLPPPWRKGMSANALICAGLLAILVATPLLLQVLDWDTTQHPVHELDPSSRSVLRKLFFKSAVVVGLAGTLVLSFIGVGSGFALICWQRQRRFTRHGPRDAVELLDVGVWLPRKDTPGRDVFMKYADVSALKLVNEDIQIHSNAVGEHLPSGRALLVEAGHGTACVNSRHFPDDRIFDAFVKSLEDRCRGIARIAEPQAMLGLPAENEQRFRERDAEVKPRVSEPYTMLGLPAEHEQRFRELDAEIRRRKQAIWLEEKTSEHPVLDSRLDAMIAGREVLKHLFVALKNDEGACGASLLCALGALAGRACQAAVRAGAIQSRKSPDADFVVKIGPDGNPYLFGDQIYRNLFVYDTSIRVVAARAAKALGAQSLPDEFELSTRSRRLLGSSEYALPRLPASVRTGATPVDYANRLWPDCSTLLVQFARGYWKWPSSLAFAIQQAIHLVKADVPAELAFQIVMDSAVPLASIPIESQAD